MADPTATENKERFFARLRPILAPSVLLQVELAYLLAKYFHRAQVRKEADAAGTPVRYFEHPRHTALILIDEVRCVEADIICAALFHDTLEDTEFTPEMMEHFFGPEVTRIVTMVTKEPKEGYVERLLAYGDWKCLMVKAADRLHNLRSLHAADVTFQRKQLAETAEKYYALLDRLVEIVPADYRRGAIYLRDEIRAKVAELTARLPAA